LSRTSSRAAKHAAAAHLADDRVIEGLLQAVLLEIGREVFAARSTMPVLLEDLQRGDARGAGAGCPE
jgi:hypothetical protein